MSTPWWELTGRQIVGAVLHVTPCEKITLNTVPIFNLQTCDRPARYLISEALESCISGLEPPYLLPFGQVSTKDLETPFKIES